MNDCGKASQNPFAFAEISSGRRGTGFEIKRPYSLICAVIASFFSGKGGHVLSADLGPVFSQSPRPAEVGLLTRPPVLLRSVT